MNRDKAFDLLYQSFDHSLTPALWLVDENIDTTQIPNALPDYTAIANRFNVAKSLNQKNWECSFSDFDLSALPPNTLKRIYLRIPKEKALAHYLINQSSRLLTSDGSLILSGQKQEGIKGYFDRAEKAGAIVERWKSDKDTWAAELKFPHLLALDDKDYATQRQTVSDDILTFWSKPGVFGWDKIDQGSALLVEHLATLIQAPLPTSALDLGCGYGYLSLHTSKIFSIPVTATDNNAAALHCCQKNADHHRLPITLVADDCGKGIQDTFDLVVCNPPFHSGFGVENLLTDRFLQSTAQHLRPDGQAIFVTNLHIGIEKKAEAFFRKVETPVRTDHFKLIRLAEPKC